MIDETLQRKLKEVTYSGDRIPELTKEITNELLQGTKRKLSEVYLDRAHGWLEFNFDRYKFVVDVTICEAKNQGFRVASRCLWDLTTDSCASASFKNSSLFAIGVVFGCYFE